MKSYLYILVIISLVAPPLVAYSEQANESAAVSPAGQEQVSNETDSAEAFSYQIDGRRDPFTPLVRKEEPPAEIRAQRRPEQLRGPLERYEMGQLRLIAVMVVKGVPRAMVAAPDDKSYTVKIDDYIGLNGGRVTDIQTRQMDVDETGMRVEKHPDRIVVEETGVDTQSGQVVKQERYIVL